MKINDVTDCMYVNNAKISFVPNYKFNIRLLFRLLSTWLPIHQRPTKKRRP